MVRGGRAKWQKERAKVDYKLGQHQPERPTRMRPQMNKKKL